MDQDTILAIAARLTTTTMSMKPRASPRRVNQRRAVATVMDVAAGATDHTADTHHLDLVASSTTDSTDSATDMDQGTIVTITGPTDTPSFPSTFFDTNTSLSTLASLPNLLPTSPSHMSPLNLKPTLLLSPSLMLPLNLKPMQLLRLMLLHNPTCNLLPITRYLNRILMLSLLLNLRLPPHPHQRHIHNLNMLLNHTLLVC